MNPVTGTGRTSVDIGVNANLESAVFPEFPVITSGMNVELNLYQ